MWWRISAAAGGRDRDGKPAGGPVSLGLTMRIGRASSAMPAPRPSSRGSHLVIPLKRTIRAHLADDQPTEGWPILASAYCTVPFRANPGSRHALGSGSPSVRGWEIARGHVSGSVNKCAIVRGAGCPSGEITNRFKRKPPAATAARRQLSRHLDAMRLSRMGNHACV